MISSVICTQPNGDEYIGPIHFPVMPKIGDLIDIISFVPELGEWFNEEESAEIINGLLFKIDKLVWGGRIDEAIEAVLCIHIVRYDGKPFKTKPSDFYAAM